MTDRPIDLLVVGTPFLDVTLTGLERFPEPGEELLAHDLYLSPGGPAMTAVAAVRLGLAVALVAPLGDDLPGRELLRLLEGEGVQWVGPKADRTPITVLMPAPQGVAMATHLPHADISAETVSAVPASAVVVSLGRLALRPGQTRCYAVTGGLEIGRFESGVPAELAGVDAVFLTGTEATAVTGHDEPEAAAAELARVARTAIVTLGPEGAVGAAGHTVVRVPAIEFETVDATGAGDLLVAAYAWADSNGMSLEDRLCWATLYAGLSVRAPTPMSGAVSVDELVVEGRRHGLPPPALRC